MREKLMTLPLKELQQIAKANHIRYAGVRKAELVDRLCMLDEAQSDLQAGESSQMDTAEGVRETETDPRSLSQAHEPYGAGDSPKAENDASLSERADSAGNPEGSAAQERSYRPRRTYGTDSAENRENNGASERSYRPRRTYGTDSAGGREYNGTSERNYRPRRQYGSDASRNRESDANPEREYRPRRQYGAESARNRENDANPEREYRPRRQYGAESAQNRESDANSEREYRPRRQYGTESVRSRENDVNSDRTYRPRRQYERDDTEYQVRSAGRVESQESYRRLNVDEDEYTPVEELHQEYTDPAEELQKSYAATAEEEQEELALEAEEYAEEEADGQGAESESETVSVAEGEREESTSYSSGSDPDAAKESEGEEKETGANPPRRTRTFSYESDEETCGILEIMPDGYGFIRCHNYLPGEEDVYVAPSQIRKFNLQTGDFLRGKLRVRREGERFGALAFLEEVNNASLAETAHRTHFEDLTPIFPDERIYLETSRRNLAMRIVDIVSPVGKGQRGMIVSPPKAGKTTLLKEIARSVTVNHPDIHLIILLIDERPEEVTDIKEAIQGDNVEVVYSTFDELPEHHKRVSEMTIERAKRLVEQKKDVMVLLDSITRLARAYNLTIAPSGRTLSGGLDPAALYMPKKFFGAARNIREGGSLTILATALIETGSRMDDMIFEEFKGTGNMELVLDRRLSERRVFPAIDLLKSGTRREDLIMSREEQEASDIIRRLSNSSRQDDMLETVMNLFYQTRDNQEFIRKIKVTRL